MGKVRNLNDKTFISLADTDSREEFTMLVALRVHSRVLLARRRGLVHVTSPLSWKISLRPYIALAIVPTRLACLAVTPWR